MELKIEEAKVLAIDILTSRGMRHDYAGMVADHLVDAAMAGHAFAGLPRVRLRPPLRCCARITNPLSSTAATTMAM